ncbi:MAG: hypothetical protein F7B20_06035 [Aeropyrum sp.]|nr:hypothetical protein [Aeropyrum sp.]MCE4616254.1 hypothetical protein [Aeropyrum sp.]
MPTVHLSLPEAVYSDLKKRASELGIQVTDLIKLYIRMGLEKGFISSQSEESTQALMALSKKLDKLEKDVRVKTTILEGKYRHLEEAMNYIIERLEMLEETVMAAKAYSTLKAGGLEE